MNENRFNGTPGSHFVWFLFEQFKGTFVNRNQNVVNSPINGK